MTRPGRQEEVKAPEAPGPTAGPAAEGPSAEPGPTAEFTDEDSAELQRLFQRLGLSSGMEGGQEGFLSRNAARMDELYAGFRAKYGGPADWRPGQGVPAAEAPAAVPPPPAAAAEEAGLEVTAPPAGARQGLLNAMLAPSGGEPPGHGSPATEGAGEAVGFDIGVADEEMLQAMRDLTKELHNLNEHYGHEQPAAGGASGSTATRPATDKGRHAADLLPGGKTGKDVGDAIVGALKYLKGG
jgi:hypothetical protein